jgi:hypothetical protein
MRVKGILLVLSMLTGFLYSQIPVWQGFEMNWTYNHRLNRLGSFVYNDSVYATAATGIGRDSGWFNTHYMLVPETHIQYREFKVGKRIEVKENRLIQIQVDTILPIDFHHSVFFLNGFDLIANNDADKLQLLQFGVKMIKGKSDTTYLRINYSFIFNCQSIECDWVNNDVDYDLNLYIGCISFPKEDYIQYVQGEMYNGNETWTRKKNNPTIKYEGSGTAPRFITDFKIALDKAHWYSGVSAYVDETNSVWMKFEQYKDKMKKNAYYKPHANFSKRSKGSASYQMDGISLTKPMNLTKISKEFKGSIIWKGNNKSAFSKEAIRSQPK